MSPPDTNVEKQSRRHKPALIGIMVAAIAVVIFIIFTVFLPGEDAPNVEPETTQESG